MPGCEPQGFVEGGENLQNLLCDVPLSHQRSTIYIHGGRRGHPALLQPSKVHWDEHNTENGGKQQPKMYQNPSFLRFTYPCQRDLPFPRPVMSSACCAPSCRNRDRQSSKPKDSPMGEGRAGSLGICGNQQGRGSGHGEQRVPRCSPASTKLKPGLKAALTPPGEQGLRVDGNVWARWDLFFCWPCLPCGGVSVSSCSRISLCSHQGAWLGRISLGKL